MVDYGTNPCAEILLFGPEPTVFPYPNQHKPGIACAIPSVKLDYSEQKRTLND